MPPLSRALDQAAKVSKGHISAAFQRVHMNVLDVQTNNNKNQDHKKCDPHCHRTTNSEHLHLFWLQKDFVEAWEKAGVPKSKLLVGLAAYGDTWNLTVSNKFGLEAPAQGKGPPGFYTRTSGMLSYYEICEKIRSGELLPTLQPDIKTPYAHAVSGKWWISYDDESSVREKVGKTMKYSRSIA